MRVKSVNLKTYMSMFTQQLIDRLEEGMLRIWLVITQDEYDIFVITRIRGRGEAEDEC